jgi:hypothetical protein
MIANTADQGVAMSLRQALCAFAAIPIWLSSSASALPLTTTVVGAESWHGNGWCAAVGDFNGDGRADILVYDYDYPIEAFTIVWGQSAGFSSVVDLASPTTSRSRITLPIGYAGIDDFVAGDFNDDGFDDLLLWMYESNYVFRSRAYIVFGAPIFPVESTFLDGSVETATITVPVLTSCALAIASGDMNGDAIADVVVSAPCESPSGSVYVVYGSKQFPLVVNLPDQSAAMIRETQDDWRTGAFLAVGDVDGDAQADVLLSSHQTAEPYFSKATLAWGASLASGDTLDLVRHQSSTVRFRISNPLGELAGQLALGDVNADANVDVLISGSDGVYVVHGGVDWPDIVFVDNGEVPVTKIVGNPGDYGFRLRCADVTGDTYEDVVVGVSFQPGEIVVVAGRPVLPPEIAISAVDPNWKLTSTQPGDWFGLDLEVHDVDGDAIDDIVVGAPQHNSLGRTSNGAVFVYGGVNATGVVDSPVSSPPRFLTSYPNPFSAATTIVVAGPSGIMDIYDVAGRRITSIRLIGSSGRATATWDGTDSAGRRLSSGVYFARLRERAEVNARLLILR